MLPLPSPPCVVRAVKLMFSMDMILLSVTFIYTGTVECVECVCVAGRGLQLPLQGTSSTSGVECMAQLWVGLGRLVRPTLD